VTVDNESPCLAGSEPSVGVQDDLGWALATVLRSYVRAADLALVGLPGGPRGYRLLSSVARDCPRSQLVLAHHVGLDRTVVTYLLDDLAAAGLVERQADPADRRTRRVVVTAAGEKVLGELTARLEQTERQLLIGLSDEEAKVLRDLLQRVALRVTGGDDEPLSCG
jgi:DNA-binding MarR family transcriptional regulator